MKMQNKWIVARLVVSTLLFLGSVGFMSGFLWQKFHPTQEDSVAQCAAQKARIVYEITDFEKKCEGQ